MESHTRGEPAIPTTPTPARPAPSEFTAADFVELPPQPIEYSTLPDLPEIADDMGPATDPESDPENDVEEKGGWTVALLCAGIAIIACCLLLPLAEDNHQLAYQREKLKLELVQIKEQVEVNAEFLRRVADDPTLAERLARRQMRFIPQGSKVLDLPGGNGKQEMSPFMLVTLPPPAAMPAYQPLGGTIAGLVNRPRVRLYVTGAGLLLIAAGLVLGGGNKQTFDAA